MTSDVRVGSADTSAAYTKARERCPAGGRTSGWSVGRGAFDGPAEALLAYVGAFEERDAEFIGNATGPASLVEIPMLKPNRLFGRNEVLNGHIQSFASIKSASFDLSQPAERGQVAIAEGILKIERANGKTERHPLSIVVETEHGMLHRLSLYFDARFLRLWSDKTVL